ncbi:MAG: hypothetical protein Kow0098_00250 [Ignavibacteriaceae bacterium]
MNTTETKRENVDLLNDQFRKLGYMTLSRKFGRYLPEPEKVGDFQVDIIAKHKNNYAIGLIVGSDELKDVNLLQKISYLAQRRTKYSNLPVMLFIGVHSEHYKYLKTLINTLDTQIQKNIRVFKISPLKSAKHVRDRNFRSPLFS